jgi:hypothetical protein
VEELSLHIQHLERTVDTLAHDVVLLDNRLRMRLERKDSSDETNTSNEKTKSNT